MPSSMTSSSSSRGQPRSSPSRQPQSKRASFSNSQSSRTSATHAHKPLHNTIALLASQRSTNKLHLKKLLNAAKYSSSSSTKTVVTALLQIMQSNVRDQSFTDFATAFLRHLASTSDSVKPLLIKLGMTEQVLVSLKHHMAQPRIALSCIEVLYFIAFDLESELEAKPQLLHHLIAITVKAIAAHQASPQILVPACSLLFAISLTAEFLPQIADKLKAGHFNACLVAIAEEEDLVDVVGLLKTLLHQNEVCRDLVLSDPDASAALKSHLQILSTKHTSNVEVMEAVGAAILSIDAHSIKRADEARRRLEQQQNESVTSGGSMEPVIEASHHEISLLTARCSRLDEENRTMKLMMADLTATCDLYHEQALMSQEDLAAHRLQFELNNPKLSFGTTSTPSKAGGAFSDRTKAVTESTRVARNIIESFLREKFNDEDVPMDAGRIDRFSYIAADASTALELNFQSLLNDTTAGLGGVVPKSRFRKFLQNLRLCELAQADLKISQHIIHTVKGGIGFKTFVEIALGLCDERWSSSSSSSSRKKETGETVVRRMTDMLNSRIASNSAVTSKPPPPPISTETVGTPTPSNGQQNSAHRQILEAESSTMMKIFSFYATQGSSRPPQTPSRSPTETPCTPATSTNLVVVPTPGTTTARKVALQSFISLKNVLRFTRDFCITPDLVSRQFCEATFKEMLNAVTPVSRSSILHEDEDLGLTFRQFLDFLCHIAVSCNWFVKKGGVVKKDRGRMSPNTRSTHDQQAVLALLASMDSSSGKARLNRARGNGVIGAFKFNSENLAVLADFF